MRKQVIQTKKAPAKPRVVPGPVKVVTTGNTKAAPKKVLVDGKDANESVAKKTTSGKYTNMVSHHFPELGLLIATTYLTKSIQVCARIPFFMNSSESTGLVLNFDVVLKSPRVIENILNWIQFKAGQQIKKTDWTKRGSHLTSLPKLFDTNNAGTKYAKDCTLILTKRDSAKSLAIAGLSVIGHDNFGIMKNEEIQAIKKIMGLQHAKNYMNTASLRYGRLMIMADQIFTPIVRVTIGKQSKDFFTIPEYEQWTEITADAKKWDVKYYYGLGTSKDSDIRDYFSHLEKHYNMIPSQAGDRELIELTFSNKKADERKEWLLQFKICCLRKFGISIYPRHVIQYFALASRCFSHRILVCLAHPWLFPGLFFTSSIAPGWFPLLEHFTSHATFVIVRRFAPQDSLPALVRRLSTYRDSRRRPILHSASSTRSAVFAMSHHTAPYKLLGACAPALRPPPTASPPCPPSTHAPSPRDDTLITLIRFPTGHPLAARPASSHGSVTGSVQAQASHGAIAGRGDRSSGPSSGPSPPSSSRSSFPRLLSPSVSRASLVAFPLLPLIVPPRVPHPLSPRPSSRSPLPPSSSRLLVPLPLPRPSSLLVLFRIPPPSPRSSASSLSPFSGLLVPLPPRLSPPSVLVSLSLLPPRHSPSLSVSPLSRPPVK
ncbi:hypothetical protein C8R44DRAFT_893725 [Mycena epipterygia]|nr:hypothetical protein C8R44DRAFT_893725 [Mycena epipterygia]